MYTVDRSTALKDKMAHRFVPGIGYIFQGKHAMPEKKQCHKHECEPPIPTNATPGSWHLLSPPNGSKPMRMQWFNGEWMPVLGQGNRIGFTSEYLAAHGWRYKSAV